MSIPHRYVTPTYPGAAGFDLMNVVSGGVGGIDGSSYADGAKIGGPTAGTYFVAFGEDATSSNANRGLRALSQNCDAIDDRLNRPIAITVRAGDATAVGPVTSITLPVATFLGVPGTPNTVAGLDLLFQVLDSSDNEIIDVSGNRVKVNSVTLGAGDLIGGGGANGMFSGNTVQLNISPSIPNGTVYRVYYGTRTNLWSLPEDAFTNVKIRGAQEIEAGVENLFLLLHGNSLAWNAPWTSTIYDLAISGLYDRYNRRTSALINPPETYWTSALNSSGSGGWIYREGPALTMYSFGDDAGSYTDPMNALFAAKFNDTLAFDSAGITGFVAYGSRRSGSNTTGESDYEPGAASFLALWPHHTKNTVHATNPFTRILEWATASFSNVGGYNGNTGEAIVTVTQSGNYFRTAGGLSSVSVGYDMVECIYTIGGVTHREVYVIVALGASNDSSNTAKARVRRLDGSVPDFSANPTGTIRWMSLTFGVGDGASRYHKAKNGYADNVSILFDGLFYQVPPSLSIVGGDDNVPRVPASFSAQTNGSGSKALQWGGFRSSQPSGPVFPGSYLQGDGGLHLVAASNIQGANFTANGGDLVATNSTPLGAGGGVKGNLLITEGNGPSGVVGPGNPLITLDCSLGSLGGCFLTGSGYTVVINVLSVRKGGDIYMMIDHSTVTGPVTLDWTAGGFSGITHRFSGAGADQVPGVGRTLWRGKAASNTEIWWHTTRY